MFLVFEGGREGGGGVKGQKYPRMKKKKKKDYIRHVLYLRNSVAYDHSWKIPVKGWYLQAVVKGQKVVQSDKKNCCAPNLRNHTLYDFSFMLHICEMILSGHILDLYCIRQLNAASSCKNYRKQGFNFHTFFLKSYFGLKNYRKLYFDAKLLEKGLNRDTVKSVVHNAVIWKNAKILFFT